MEQSNCNAGYLTAAVVKLLPDRIAGRGRNGRKSGSASVWHDSVDRPYLGTTEIQC